MDSVTSYAKRVIRGDILASEKVILACKRHINNLNDPDFPYTFDVERANKVINFIEYLPDPKTGKLLKAAGFQKFIVGSLYGWVDSEGNRRFNKSYISMARKNGKTLLISGLSLYQLLMGEEPVNERLIGLTANSREQASIAYDMIFAQLSALRMRSKKVRDRTKITSSLKEIMYLKDRSKVKAVSAEASNLEGFQFSSAVIDEYHEAKDKKMYEALRRGQVQLSNASLDIISTAGTNLNSPMYEEYEFVTKLLEDGGKDNENYFVFVAEQDSEEEIHDPVNWIKSNPLMEIEAVKRVFTKNITEELNEAIKKKDLNGLLIKTFNMWRQGGRDSYLKASDWRACKTTELFDIRGREVYIGLDMSRRDDLTAVGFIYPDDGGYFVDAHVFVGHKGGLESKSERDKIDYQRLIDSGLATLTDTTSGIINDTQVINYIANFINDNDLDVKSIVYDPHMSSGIIVGLEKHPWPLVEGRQGYLYMSEPLKQFKLDVFEKKVKHNGNPNLSIAVNNAVIKMDNNTNIILDKKKNREKIDALVALITGFQQAMHHEHNKNLEEYIMSDDFGF